MARETLQWKQIAGASGTVACVAAVAGRKIKLVDAIIPSTAAISAYFASASTQIGPTLVFAANTMFDTTKNIRPLNLETVAGEALNLVFSATPGTVKFVITYELI